MRAARRSPAAASAARCGSRRSPPGGSRRRALVLVQRAQRVCRQVVLPALVVARSEISSPRLSVTFCSPSRIRPFTVPSGMPRNSAISLWVNPPKYARRITWAWSCGRSPSTPRTWRARSRREASASVSSGAACASSTPSSSRSGRAGRAADRRIASIARLRTICSSHERTLPRAALKLGARPPDGEERLLGHVLGRLRVAHDPVCQGVGGATVAVVEDLERPRVPAPARGPSAPRRLAARPPVVHSSAARWWDAHRRLARPAARADQPRA